MDVGFAKTGIIAINVKRIADMLKRAFTKNIKENTMVIDANAVYNWWLERDILPGQLTLDDELEVDDG